MNLIAPGIDRPIKLDGTEIRPEEPAEVLLQKLARVLLDSMATVALLLTPDGAVLDANRAALAVLGLTREQATGKPFSDHLQAAAAGNDPQVCQKVTAAVAGSAQGEISRWMVEMGREGMVVALEFTLRPITDDSARITFLLAEGRDVSEQRLRQREAERRIEGIERECSRLQGLLDESPAGMGFVAGRDHVWTYLNDAYVRLTGRGSVADFIGKTVGQTLPELEAQGYHRQLDEVYRTGKPFVGRDVKWQVDRASTGQPDEGYFDFEYRPVREDGGRVCGVFIYVAEVTDKVMARKLAEETSERLRVAQAAGRIGTWEWDPIRGSNVLSPELHRLFGTSLDDPERVEKWLSRIYPADRPRVELLMYEGHRLGSMEFDYRYMHPDTGLRWLFCKGMRRPGETRMLGVVQDITARKIAEQAGQRLAAIVECSDDAIVSKDLKGIVTSWNPAAQNLFGYTSEEMIGQSITKIIPPELYSDENRILSTIARGERIEHFETVRLKKNGELVEISLTVSPVRDESGNIVGAAKIARDITQRKKVEQALRTTERLASVGRLAATVAHEINNPLEAVTNLIFLARSAHGAEQVHTYLGMAEEELERISQLTKQTLGFYRETKGTTAVRIGGLVDSLLSVFMPRMRNRSIQLTKEIAEDLEIRAIPGEIRQVVANLMGNSIDAMEAGGRIRVRVAPAVQWKGTVRRGVRLTVADNGSGIPFSIRSQLFEPFFTTKKDVGTGLGLWICKSIVEHHQGSIQVCSSTTPGKSGTVFSVFLPLDAEHAIGSIDDLRTSA